MPEDAHTSLTLCYAREEQQRRSFPHPQADSEENMTTVSQDLQALVAKVRRGRVGDGVICTQQNFKILLILVLELQRAFVPFKPFR